MNGGNVRSRPHLELARLRDVLDALERLVHLAVHVETVDLQAGDRELVDAEPHVDRRVLQLVAGAGDGYLNE